MIAKEDLEAYSTYRDRYQVEKDYLQDLIVACFENPCVYARDEKARKV